MLLHGTLLHGPDNKVWLHEQGLSFCMTGLLKAVKSLIVDAACHRDGRLREAFVSVDLRYPI